MTDEAPADAGEDAPPAPKFMFWFTLPDGSKFTHLDMTAAEALAIEKRLGVSYWQLRPVHVVEHAVAALETFLARTDPENAAARVAAMTMRELDTAVIYEEGRDDDLPDGYTDGLPK